MWFFNFFLSLNDFSIIIFVSRLNFNIMEKFHNSIQLFSEYLLLNIISERLRQENSTFEANLSYTARSCLIKPRAKFVAR